jgi:hypothetical protein
MEAKQPWKILKSRGIGAPRLVDYVIEAEFDIDTGSTVRYQYPQEVPDYKPDWFAEHMLPEGAHNRVLDYTYIFLNRNGVHIDQHNWIKPENEQSNASVSPAPPDQKPFLYGLNLVKTRHDSSVRRGAIVKAMCIFSRYSLIEAFKKPLELSLDEFFDNQSVDVLQRLFDQLNSVDTTSLPWPNIVEQQLMRRGIHYDTIRTTLPDHLPRSWMHSVECPSSQGTLTLQYPLYHTPDEIGDISVVRLVKIFGDATMKIFHGILTKQRVLFVGYGHSAHDIAQMVLSAVAMVAPPMTNLIRRTFPYANLTDLSFLEVKGYIAGVTNPMFQQRESWWDILCVLDLPNNTGTVITTEDKKSEPLSSGSMHHSVSTATLAAATDTADVPVKGLGSAHASRSNLSVEESNNLHFGVDQRFIQSVISGINALIGEEWTRQQFADYAATLLTFIQDKNMLLHMSRLEERTRRIAEANLQRLTVLELSSEFKDMPKHPWVWDTLAGSETTSGTGTIMSAASVREEAVPASPKQSSITSSESAPARNTALEPAPSLQVPLPSTTISSPLNPTGMFNPLSLKTKLLRLRLDQSTTFVREMETHMLMAEKYLISETAIQGLVILFPESQGGLTPFAAGMFHASPVIRYCTLVILNRIQCYASCKAAFDGMNTFLLAGYKRLQEKLVDGSLIDEAQKRTEKLFQIDGTVTPQPPSSNPSLLATIGGELTSLSMAVPDFAPTLELF